MRMSVIVRIESSIVVKSSSRGLQDADSEISFPWSVTECGISSFFFIFSSTHFSKYIIKIAKVTKKTEYEMSPFGLVIFLRLNELRIDWTLWKFHLATSIKS